MGHEFTKATPDNPVIISAPTKRGGLSLESVKVEIPFSLYEGETNKTYTEEFFNIDNQEGIKTIENFVIRQIDNRNLIDSIKTYQSIIEELSNKIGIDENETNDSKFFKIVRYINLLSRNKSLDDKKRDLLRREKDAEKKKEELRDKLFKSNYEKTKQDKKDLLQKNKEMRDKMEKLEETNQKVLEEKIELQRQLEGKIAKLKDVKLQTTADRNRFTKEFNRTKNELEKTKLQAKILIEKQNKLKNLIR